MLKSTATCRIEDLRSFGFFFCRFWYSVIASCILASVSACFGSLARVMVAVEDDYFNLVGGMCRWVVAYRPYLNSELSTLTAPLPPSRHPSIGSPTAYIKYTPYSHYRRPGLPQTLSAARLLS